MKKGGAGMALKEQPQPYSEEDRGTEGGSWW